MMKARQNRDHLQTDSKKHGVATRWLALFTLLIGSTAPSAQAQDSTLPVSENSLASSPWYDAETQSVRPINVREQLDDSINRNSRWLPKPDKVSKSTSQGTGGGAAAGGGSGLSLSNAVGWLIIAILVAMLIGGLFYAFRRTDVDLGTSRSEEPLIDTTDSNILERIQELPAELRRTDVNLRSEAQRLMEIGQLDQAIILLFGHQLLLLDKVGALRLNRGKTNGRYVRETKAFDPGASLLLRSTATCFERSYFGRHALMNSEFQRLWKDNVRLEQTLADRQGSES